MWSQKCLQPKMWRVIVGEGGCVGRGLGLGYLSALLILGLKGVAGNDKGDCSFVTPPCLVYK